MCKFNGYWVQGHNFEYKRTHIDRRTKNTLDPCSYCKIVMFFLIWEFAIPFQCHVGIKLIQLWLSFSFSFNFKIYKYDNLLPTFLLVCYSAKFVINFMCKKRWTNDSVKESTDIQSSSQQVFLDLGLMTNKILFMLVNTYIIVFG